MNIPFPSQLPRPLRACGRFLLPSSVRARIAADLHYLAQLQSYRHLDYRRSQSALASLHNAHRGQSCIILGNGPSLADQDLSRLDGIPTFCLNRGYLLWNEQRLKPTYLVAVNDLLIEQFNKELAMVGCPLFVPWQYRNRFSATEHAVFLTIRWHKRFFADARKGVWPGMTVTFAALQLAYHMGFAKVGLIGVDHRFHDDGPAHQEIIQKTDDANHFSPNYFGKGVRWHLPDISGSEMAYALARDAYASDGRVVIDMTRDGALRVFPKMTLEDAFDRGLFPRP